MKPYLYTLLAAAAASGLAQAQTAYTTPVGYVTQNLAANRFSFVGLTVHNPTLSSGVLDASASSSVTDTGVDFSALLTASETYVLELDNGIIQEITSWSSAGVLNTPEDISASVTPGTTKYKLRKASTISQIFGATNSAGLVPDTDDDFLNGNDLVYVLGGSGAVTIVYYFPGNQDAPAGWYTGDGEDANNIPIIYPDGFYVRRVAGSSIDLVTTGEVKTNQTSNILIPNWNFVSSVAPAGLKLSNSGLNNFISVLTDPDGSFESVDNVYIPKADGSFRIAYYFNDGETQGWFDGDGEPADEADLSGAFLILNRGLAKPYTLSVPSSYSGL